MSSGVRAMRSNLSLMKNSSIEWSWLPRLPREMQETPGLKSAVEELQEGMKALRTRQKLIRLADCSDLGWAVVDAATCPCLPPLECSRIFPG